MGGKIARKRARARVVIALPADSSRQYYFTYCEAGFVTKTLGDVIITVGREGAMELMEDIPV